MSRSGLTDADDVDDPLELGRWRGAVKMATYSKRGQAFLKEALAVLDAMPDKRLAREDFVVETGGMPWQCRRDVCLLGAVGEARGVDISKLDYDRPEELSPTFGIADALARNLVWINDEGHYKETPEQRWARVRGEIMCMIAEED